MKVKAKVGTRGRITIPKKLRDELSIEKGDELVFDTGKKTFSIQHSKKPVAHLETAEDREIKADLGKLEQTLTRVFGPMGVSKEAITSALASMKEEQSPPPKESHSSDADSD